MGKRRLRHPEAVAKERATTPQVVHNLSTRGWMPDYGWAIILYADEQKTTRHLPPGTTREEAHREARLALRENRNYYKAWVVQKTLLRKE